MCSSNFKTHFSISSVGENNVLSRLKKFIDLKEGNMKKSKTQFIFPELRPPDNADIKIQNIGKQEIIGYTSSQKPTKPKQREIKSDEAFIKRKLT